MAYTYTAVVQTPFYTNKDQIAIEVAAPANTTVKIKKIRIMHDDGTATAATTIDYQRKVKLVLESGAGTGGTSYTPIPVDASAPASVSTVNINNTGVFFVPGTISKTIDVMSIHSTSHFLWQARDEDDKIVVAPNGIFAIIVNPAQ